MSKAQRIVVTGAAGFIGSHLTDRLVAGGHRVIAIDNLAVGRERNLIHARESGRCDFHRVDVNDPSAASLYEGADTVYHLAALADIVPSIERPQDYFRANV